MQMNSKHKKVVKWRSYWSPLSTPNRAECHMLDKPGADPRLEGTFMVPV
nr:MAG: hypothetical protein [Apis mellifera filamentous virus]